MKAREVVFLVCFVAACVLGGATWSYAHQVQGSRDQLMEAQVALPWMEQQARRHEQGDPPVRIQAEGADLPNPCIVVQWVSEGAFALVEVWPGGKVFYRDAYGTSWAATFNEFMFKVRT
jgi:hypothetical protein